MPYAKLASADIARRTMRLCFAMDVDLLIISTAMLRLSARMSCRYLKWSGSVQRASKVLLEHQRQLVLLVS
jgi:hypothetical protein